MKNKFNPDLVGEKVAHGIVLGIIAIIALPLWTLQVVGTICGELVRLKSELS